MIKEHLGRVPGSRALPEIHGSAPARPVRESLRILIAGHFKPGNLECQNVRFYRRSLRENPLVNAICKRACHF
jgi:hypothetical protein